MKEILSDQQIEAVLQSLDEAIKTGPWDQSNFLRAIGKNLSSIREKFVSQLGTRTQKQIKEDNLLANRLALRRGQQEVFVSLYSSEGNNVQSWEKIVSNLPRQMISRPIFALEDHVKALIKMKENKHNEAYISIHINQTDIISLPPDKVLCDKSGNALLTLKDKTLDLENINRFVHSSGTYHYDHGRLIKDL